MLSPDVGAYSGVPEQSFDFSKFPNLQEVNFGVSWVGGDLHWIPKALSTLRPPTSPRLSAIQIDFIPSSNINRSVEIAIKDTGNDLRWVTEEIARIKHEFGVVVNLTVFRDPVIEAVLQTLDVRFNFCGVDDASDPC